MALTIHPDNFQEIKDQENRKFYDYLFADLQIDSWFLKPQFHIVDCKFINCSFGGEVNFNRGVFKNVTFENCKFNGTSFQYSMINNTMFLNCVLYNGCSFFNTTFNFSKLIDNSITDSEFTDTHFIESNFEGGEFMRNDIHNLYYRGTGHLFNNVKYEHNYGKPKKSK